MSWLRAGLNPAADGAMRGKPWLVKEGLDYAGMPTRSGSRAFAGAGPITTVFSCTRCFDDAGMVAIGKTSAPGFGLLPTTESLLYGLVHNPWHSDWRSAPRRNSPPIACPSPPWSPIPRSAFSGIGGSGSERYSVVVFDLPKRPTQRAAGVKWIGRRKSARWRSISRHGVGKSMAPRVGFEPTTDRLTVDCSTAELPRNIPPKRTRRPLCRRSRD